MPLVPYWFYVFLLVIGSFSAALMAISVFIFLCGKAYRWLTFETHFWPYRWEAIKKYAASQKGKNQWPWPPL